MNPRKLPFRFMLTSVVMVLLCYLPNTAVGQSTIALSAAGVQTSEIAPRLILEAGGHTAVINGLIFTADGRELISPSDDKTISVWSV